MVSKLADQSRRASLIASLSVRPPLSTGTTRRTHQLHPEDVELLPLDILGAHVDDGFEAQQSADDRRRDAVLPRARFGDQPGLAHALGEQPLPEHLIGLVRAAVEQILALEIDVARQVAAAGQRRRPAGVIREQAVELGDKGGIVLRIEERRLELLERRDQNLRHVSAAEPAEPPAQAHARNRSRADGRSASNRAAIFSGDFMPGLASTAEPTSIA